MNAGFFKRLMAYIIDLILVLLISTTISAGINTNTKDYEEQLSNVMNDYMEGEVTIDDYLSQTKDLTYSIQKENIMVNIISCVITIGYYIVFTYLNKGQSIGKKLLKIKIVDKETKEAPSIKAIILRSIIIYSIISGLFNIIFINLLNKNIYFIGYNFLATIEEILIIVSAFMILYRKDKRGLQDIIAKTEVIEERR